ncbi:CD44 antigen [Heptranchias perlo]|uniref:CD44 antigen n=1 Tax=Heptranchias perlo TaxID=212740 RepID=UPI00355A4D06
MDDVKTECGHHGVFQRESGGRYQLDFRAAADLCQSLGTTLATLGQLERAQAAGYETCRYGWIQDGQIAIPRVHHHPVCGNNFIGVYIIQKPLTKKSDVFCFNVTEYENCSSERRQISTPYDADPGISRINNIPTISGESIASSLRITTEGPMVTSEKSHVIVTGHTMATERPSSSSASVPRSSQSVIHSMPSPSAAAIFRESALPEDQPTRPASSATPGFTTKLDTLPTRPGHVASSHNKTTPPSLKKNTRVVTDGSGFASDIELVTERMRGMSLNTESQDTKIKMERRSGTDLTTMGNVADPSPSAVLSDNTLGVNATEGSTKDNANRSDFQPTLEGSSMLQINTESEQESISAVTSSQPSETTHNLTKFGTVRRGGTSSISTTPNPADLPEEIANSTGLFSSELLLDKRTPGRKETFSISPSHLPVESGSAPETLSSEPAKVLVDLLAVTVLDEKWISSNSPSPDPSDLPVESGSAPEILSSEPTEALSDYSTVGVLVNNRRISISASADPALLFVEGGSTPEILSSELPGSDVGFIPDFTVTTDVAGVPGTSQQTAAGSGRESDLPVRSTLQSVEVDQTPPERLSGYLSTAAMPSSAPDPLTSSLLHSPEASSAVFPMDANNKRGMEPAIASSQQTTVHTKLITPGLTDTAKIYSTPGFGLAASSLTTTNRATQMSAITVGTQQKAKPTSTKTSGLIILNDDPHLKLQPSTTSVGAMPSEASLDWLIVVAIIVSLLIILIGGAVIIYSKRLCGRKKSLVITRRREDGAAIMEKGAANGNRADLLEEDDLKADIKRSGEWIQLMNKDNAEVVSEPAEAAKLMKGNESGEPSNREMEAATQEEEEKS